MIIMNKHIYIVIFFLLFCVSSTFAQSIITPIALNDVQKKEICSLLEKYHSSTKGICSELKIYKSHLDNFEEIGDYGPMYYGHTYNVNQDGILIKYNFKSIDSNKDWQSCEEKFLPQDRSAIYSKYTCSFGFPPSHGFSNRKRKWNHIFDTILSIINK